MDLEYKVNTAARDQIYNHLVLCCDTFIPPLNTYTDIPAYTDKIFQLAEIFEAWAGNTFAGFIAAYFNDNENKAAYISNISVLKEFAGQGIAEALMHRCIEFAKSNYYTEISLGVNKNNTKAFHFYAKFNFKKTNKMNGDFLIMHLLIK